MVSDGLETIIGVLTTLYLGQSALGQVAYWRSAARHHIGLLLDVEAAREMIGELRLRLFSGAREGAV